MKRSKYGAKPTMLDGVRFHSTGEAQRWAELKLLERAREIASLSRQVPIFLHAQGGVTIGKYIADFCYLEAGKTVLEDWKGVDTPLSKWKRAHVHAEYGQAVRITGAARKAA